MARNEGQQVDTLPTQMYGHDGSDIQKLSTTLDGTKHRLDVTTGLSTMPGFNIAPFDRIDATYPTTTTEVYTYSLDSVAHTTITITYETATKEYITSSVKADL